MYNIQLNVHHGITNHKQNIHNKYIYENFQSTKFKHKQDPFSIINNIRNLILC
jgi:hypothetical protein